jgi:hypothetical protein
VSCFVRHWARDCLSDEKISLHTVMVIRHQWSMSPQCWGWVTQGLDICLPPGGLGRWPCPSTCGHVYCKLLWPGAMVTPVILATQRQRSGGWRLKASPGTLSRKTTSQKRADGVAQDEGQVQAPVPPKKKICFLAF